MAFLKAHIVSCELSCWLGRLSVLRQTYNNDHINVRDAKFLILLGSCSHVLLRALRVHTKLQNPCGRVKLGTLGFDISYTLAGNLEHCKIHKLNLNPHHVRNFCFLYKIFHLWPFSFKVTYLARIPRQWEI